LSRVLAYTSPARGHLYPLTPILLELQRRGHAVSVRTLEGEVAQMRELGFDARPIDRKIEAINHDDYQAKNPRAALARSVGVFVARAEHDRRDLAAAIEDEKPDAVIVDVNSWGAAAAAEAWGAPWASFCPYPLPLASRDAPPFGPGFAPARGIGGRLRDALMRPLVMGTLARTMLPKINVVRADAGLAPYKSINELFTRPPLLLYLTAEPFEYHRTDWPPNIVMTGPCEWDPTETTPTWLGEINKPIVLVTSSSEFQDDGRLVQAALDGLAGEDVHVVATVPAGDPGAFSVPANARVERFVSHGPVLERAIVAITHGGMGATQKALARGVPVVAVPFGRDQFEVARRVEVAGAGVRLPASKLTPEALRDAVARARTMRDGAAGVAAGYARAGGAVAAAEAVEGRLLSAIRPAPRADAPAADQRAVLSPR
jgi:MGT family glycosyltransferase